MSEIKRSFEMFVWSMTVEMSRMHAVMCALISSED